MPQTRAEKSFFVLILAGYLVIAGLFAVRTPAWQNPDEPAHYNYVRQVASGTLIPVIQTGDWDNDYLEALKANRFHPDSLDRIDTIRYENHQPPLYYWLLAPVYLLTGGSLPALRLMSVLLGAGSVILAWRIGRQTFPEQPQVSLAAMALVAFLPQHVAILASVNNDALAGLMIALTLHQILVYLNSASSEGAAPHRPYSVPFRLGMLVGLIFITKTTGYFMAGVVLLALWLKWRSAVNSDAGKGRSTLRPYDKLIKSFISFAIPAGLFALFWWGRNIAVYGFPDFLGLRAHDAVVVGQQRTTDLIAQVGTGEYLRRGAETSFNSFWGQFGWMGVPMNSIPRPGDNFIYPALLVLCLVAGTGLILATRARHVLPLQVNLKNYPILFTVIVLTVLMYLYYNTQFVQFQGRYLFTAIIPFALLFVAGIDAWRIFLLSRFPRSTWLTVLLMLLFALLDIYLIWRVIPGALMYE
jgi:4-amino-4-deoxy-L-arabinose transferase-like glycosyltransferase